jgi:hypothetical protein
MGREPEALRKCLEATERRSLQTIHKFDFARFTNVSKPTSRRKKTQAPQGDKVREEIRSLLRQIVSLRPRLLDQAPNDRSAGIMSWRCGCVSVRSGSIA